MSRPFKERRVACRPGVTFFKPRGVPLRELDVVTLGVDELEAIRLADLEGLYQADAAERMGVSRQTLGNILTSAHRKIAHALNAGMAICIEGGAVAEAGSGHACRGAGEGRRRRGWCGGRGVEDAPEETARNKEQT